MKKILFGIIVFVLLAAGVSGVYYYLSKNKTNTPQPTVSPTPTSVVIETPTSVPTTQPENSEGEDETNMHPDWLTYTNSEYGFEISYPSNYQALDDKNNLYGWPNGIVLIYSGGQSYDLPIEVWDSASEYQNKYQAQMDDLTVKQVGNKFITLLNMNKNEEVDEIISTFTPIP
jgi:hypothetical protein